MCVIRVTHSLVGLHLVLAVCLVGVDLLQDSVHALIEVVNTVLHVRGHARVELSGSVGHRLCLRESRVGR